MFTLLLLHVAQPFRDFLMPRIVDLNAYLGTIPAFIPCQAGPRV